MFFIDSIYKYIIDSVNDKYYYSTYLFMLEFLTRRVSCRRTYAQVSLSLLVLCVSFLDGAKFYAK